MNIQFKKGVLELCVLSMLMKKDQYGYELASTISQFIEISDGSLYPILRKLAADGQVTTYLQESSGGPPRKYYSITAYGRQLHRELRREWQTFAQSVETLMTGFQDQENQENQGNFRGGQDYE